MASTSALTLDHLAAPSSDSPAFLDAHLFYPNLDDGQSTLQSTEQRPLLKDRLYVGNLHPSVDEYTLLQVFSKFGKITKLDWLYHKAGLLKGKPRGYAFVEYATADDAMNAMTSAHGKLLRGRKLVVTFAHQAPLDQSGSGTGTASARGRKPVMDVGRPTALSMLKTGLRGHEGKTKDKIAILEAKLRQMEHSTPIPGVAVTSPSPAPTPAAASTPSPAPSTPAHDPTQPGDCEETTLAPTLPPAPSAHTNTPAPSTLPTHPSLPAKPPAQVPGAPAPVAPPWLAAQQLSVAGKAPVTLTTLAKPGGAPALFAGTGAGGFGGASGHRTKKLVGVKIKKEKIAGKEKEQDKGNAAEKRKGI